jgi:hypothetical protein
VTDDDDLRALLRRADPAASLEPAAPAQVAHLVEEAMSSRTKKWALPVAAAMVLIAGGTAWAVTRSDAPPAPLAAPTATASGTAGSVVLFAPGMQAKCRAPEAGRLAEAADFAFEGTVQKIENGRVTLAVSQTFRGEAVGQVEVAQEGASSETMLGSGKFEMGKVYLVSAADSNVMICGYSGEADSIGLRDLYEAAF